MIQTLLRRAGASLDDVTRHRPERRPRELHRPSGRRVGGEGAGARPAAPAMGGPLAAGTGRRCGREGTHWCSRWRVRFAVKSTRPPTGFCPTGFTPSWLPRCGSPDDLMRGGSARRSWSGKRRPRYSRRWRRGPAGRSSARRMARPTPRRLLGLVGHARRRSPGGSGSRMGAGVRPPGGSAGALGDGPWTPPTGFGRQSRLMRPRSSPSSAAASAIHGARPAFAKRWTRPGRSAWWPMPGKASPATSSPGRSPARARS